MDPNTSIGRLCLGENDRISLNDKIESEGNWEGPEYQDIADSGRKKEVKAFTFPRMETEEVSERYITPCFVEGLDAYDGITDLEYEKKMISNELAVKLRLPYELKKNEERVVNHEVLIILKGELYFVIVNDDSDDEIDALLANINVYDLPPLETTCHLLEELENDLYERILILNEPSPVIETLKYSDQHKKMLDSVLLYKLKLDGELKVKEEAVGEEFIKSYKAIKEKNDPGVFVLPIHLEGKYDFHALVDTGSNINVMPYRIYEKLGREQVKPLKHKITMLNHSKAKPIGILLDMLYQ
ncbi:DNA-directed DNA polymerase [Tanacetum coccineum]